MEIETKDCGKLLYRTQISKSPCRIVKMVLLDCVMWTTATLQLPSVKPVAHEPDDWGLAFACVTLFFLISGKRIALAATVICEVLYKSEDCLVII